MATKKSKGTTPGTRHYIAPVFDDITAKKPSVKKLLKGKHNTGGRNSHGRKTSRHRGGGHKRRYRTIDFRRNKADVTATVKSIEYDPNRSARIALLAYSDGVKSYIIAPDKLQVGDKVV